MIHCLDTEPIKGMEYFLDIEPMLRMENYFGREGILVKPHSLTMVNKVENRNIEYVR